MWPVARFCVAGGTMFVNTVTDCSVGIQSSTWSQIKKLYEY
jgi:hypothetical protein